MHCLKCFWSLPKMSKHGVRPWLPGQSQVELAISCNRLPSTRFHKPNPMAVVEVASVIGSLDFLTGCVLPPSSFFHLPSFSLRMLLSAKSKHEKHEKHETRCYHNVGWRAIKPVTNHDIERGVGNIQWVRFDVGVVVGAA